MTLRSICVFCGASPGASPIYREAAESLGRHIAERGLRLVYGGGAVGLMGMVADAALAAGGEVVGIIPQSLKEAEIGHKGLSRLEVVDGMHARKARMAELSDAFIALPGGLGTLEELFEGLEQDGRYRMMIYEAATRILRKRGANTNLHLIDMATGRPRAER